MHAGVILMFPQNFDTDTGSSRCVCEILHAYIHTGGGGGGGGTSV